ncbi:MAG: hypothetical protein LBJ96_03735 [Holosporaceae bacterium]|jgi:uncharacterized protein with GYD domain|nr:hypothetical protein [Holosporaceae bacterium]
MEKTRIGLKILLSTAFILSVEHGVGLKPPCGNITTIQAALEDPTSTLVALVNYKEQELSTCEEYRDESAILRAYVECHGGLATVLAEVTTIWAALGDYSVQKIMTYEEYQAGIAPLVAIRTALGGYNVQEIPTYEKYLIAQGNYDLQETPAKRQSGIITTIVEILSALG